MSGTMCCWMTLFVREYFLSKREWLRVNYGIRPLMIAHKARPGLASIRFPSLKRDLNPGMPHDHSGSKRKPVPFRSPLVAREHTSLACIVCPFSRLVPHSHRIEKTRLSQHRSSEHRPSLLFAFCVKFTSSAHSGHWQLKKLNRECRGEGSPAARVQQLDPAN